MDLSATQYGILAVGAVEVLLIANEYRKHKHEKKVSEHKSRVAQRVEDYRSMGWKVRSQDGVYFAVGLKRSEDPEGSWTAIDLGTGKDVTCASEKDAEASARALIIRGHKA